MTEEIAAAVLIVRELLMFPAIRRSMSFGKVMRTLVFLYKTRSVGNSVLARFRVIFIAVRALRQSCVMRRLTLFVPSLLREGLTAFPE